MMRLLIATTCLLLASLTGPGPRPDLVIADFEGADFGPWKTAGTAFGPGPAKGTLPNQMPVTGYLGKGLANSYHGGDKSIGTLTSPAFAVERKYINFLIGGGKYPGKTCMNLVIGDKVVRTATGPNDVPGGSEHLSWQSWDVEEFAGKQALIQVVDEATGGWGHICVDHIVQSDKKREETPAQRELLINERYLHLPVKTGAPMRHLSFVVDGKVVREFDIELADDTPTFWTFSDVSAFKGRKLKIEVKALLGESRALEAITQGATLKNADQLYKEKLRPQFHFTSRVGWLNDPNGLVYANGEYHLFYQHNPYGWNWGNMHWGHAVSKDLVHWQELGDALYPQRFGDWCFSGSALVDKHNTAGFKSGNDNVLVAVYTSTGRGECVAYSNDAGRTWTDWAGNPVVKHQGRDPKVIWHTPSKQWVMAVYDEHDKKRWIAFHTSPDLKNWKLQSRIEGFFECPDLFELPVAGQPNVSRWVLYAADGRYVLGQFDGKSFQVESGKHQLWYGNFYAAQTFSDTPDGRRIQIGWGQGITFPGMPFNQQMTVPCVLTLRDTPEGVRMFAEPVKELDELAVKKWAQADGQVKPGKPFQAELGGELLDVRAEILPGEAEGFGLTLRGITITYDAKKQEISCNKRTAPLKMIDGKKIELRLLVDRGSIEIFGNQGRVALSVGVVPTESKTVEVFARGGSITLGKLEVRVLRSAWEF